MVFKQDVIEKGNSIIQRLDLKGLQPVGVHFRFADYLILSSLNLGANYYKAALEYFDDNESIYLVFSDEIEKAKDNDFFHDKNVIYMSEKNGAAVDMYLMSRCAGGNIVANSTFSFWGAFLNTIPSHKTICPKNFVAQNSEHNFINENYYPNNWIAI